MQLSSTVLLNNADNSVSLDIGFRFDEKSGNKTQFEG